VLTIPGIARVEMSMENIGLSLQELALVLREIPEKSCLILKVRADTGFEYLPEVLRRLPREGLFLDISDKYIPTDEAYHEFVSTNWKRR
jgi:hypothetical protein